MSKKISIALVDDDDAVLDSLRLYFTATGYDVAAFAEADSLLKALSEGLEPDCIVSDIRMPALSGLELQRELSARKIAIPLILITGHGDVEMAVGAIKAGAHDFIEKPFDERRLLTSIEDAVSRRSRSIGEETELAAIAGKVAELSERQRQVMNLAVQGLSNKQIANQLGISPRTVESYRAWVMERMGAKNLAELVRLAMRLGR
ncbi:MAG: response regulator [Hyphomicrobiaceae bacterium]|nr:MAG: response regulator [Hyphomicrobiaceae bacterium]